ncbi:hypothetical protein [Nesterenkonia sp. HG001]|uniref:hypothetical protein n=1 Tax=Nesterenkonia sp. HG001 TaxID=2983207 RepID=UPI002AC51617|nr:hypothetical protein [Nesterenkonia sp. HG001]MDZ5078297.1 hypothetical protein [Nesterenkonia sp. HG001]
MSSQKRAPFFDTLPAMVSRLPQRGPGPGAAGQEDVEAPCLRLFDAVLLIGAVPRG